MRSQYEVIDTAGLKSMFGVVFEPGGARAFFRESASDFLNRDTPLEFLWGAEVDRLRSRLQGAAGAGEKLRILASLLVERVDERCGLHSGVRQALKQFEVAPHGTSVLDVAQEIGLSRRRFAQLFREQVGMTPKLYCRVLRFQKVVQQIRRGDEVNWAQVAADGGYCDQAHMAHEFREFSGITPGRYAGGGHMWRNHVPMD